MQTPASPQYNQMVRIAGMAMVMSRAAVIAALLTWTPSSIGGAGDKPAPAKSWAGPAPAVGGKEAAADPAHESINRPTRPTCAALGAIASAREAGTTGEPSVNLGCGVGSNLAGGTPASNPGGEQVDVAAFLSWHGQARSVSPYAYEATLSRPPRMRADRS